MRKITSIKQLKKLAGTEHGIECCITLANNVFSRKYIQWNCEDFYILNFIDSTEQHLTEKQILNSKVSNIGLAIKKKALVLY